MKVVALISGGKDSCMNMIKCVQYGHQIVALANLKPPKNISELDSFMYQTVGHEALDAYAECMDLPLYRYEISGSSLNQKLQYKKTENDEVENLFNLLKQIKEKHPEITAVSSGAILSNYQRTRVENVCTRLNLVSLAYLWERNQSDLLSEMIDSNLDAILIKVAAMGLKSNHLGKSISELYSYFQTQQDSFGFNVCGEGGEYETFTLDCPLFKKRIVLDETETLIHSDDAFAPVSFFIIKKYHLEEKPNFVSDYPKKINQVSVTAPQNLIQQQNKQELDETDFEFTINEISNENNFKIFSTNICCKPTSKLKYYDPNISQIMTKILFQNFNEILKNNKKSFKDIFFVSISLSKMQYFSQLNQIYCTYFDTLSYPPSRECTEKDEDKIEISITFWCDFKELEKNSLYVQSISCWAPACIGPYSQCYTVGDLTFFAGMIGLDPPTMNLISQNLKTENCLILETDQIIENLNQVMKIIKTEYPVFCHIFLLKEDLEENKKKIESKILHWLTSKETELIPIVFSQVTGLPKNANIEIQIICCQKNNKVDYGLPAMFEKI